jgi:hypothetical protein
VFRKPKGVLDEDEVMRGRLTHSQNLIVSEGMPSTRPIPAIRSLGVGGSPATDLFRSVGRW